MMRIVGTSQREIFSRAGPAPQGWRRDAAPARSGRKQNSRSRARNGLRPAWLLPPILLCLSLAASSTGRITFADAPLAVSPEGELATSWQVLEARLFERADGTTGYLRLRNVSGTTLEGGIFYAEYSDARGRFCFSLVFSQTRNIPIKGPVAPGGVRELYSNAPGLFPASEPKGVRVYLVRESIAGRAGSTREWGAPFRAPVTLSGNVRTDATQLHLGPEVAGTEAPFLDLVLAKVRVDEKGSVGSVEVVNALNEQLESWFIGFARRELTFYPATESWAPRPGDALVLTRVILSEEGVANSPFLPRMSPWVQSYVAGISGSDLVPVTQIGFSRFRGKVNRAGTDKWIQLPPLPPGIFQLFLFGSYWSTPAVRMVPDPSAPGHLRRELLAADPGWPPEPQGSPAIRQVPRARAGRPWRSAARRPALNRKRIGSGGQGRGGNFSWLAGAW
jgi:hypothetical protein